ncbi:unnamed protein product [Adineta ricciae]|uniref:Uncharacterized protein n=1 Tax=Adineta ricciae TaxID=249248 RepID=A0A815XYM0_ADIRI|nr:unnamed protein product [Adineta ricciae]CAF1563415.1 unnamed protein product [Adineta ricciae]
MKSTLLITVLILGMLACLATSAPTETADSLEPRAWDFWCTVQCGYWNYCMLKGKQCGTEPSGCDCRHIGK